MRHRACVLMLSLGLCVYEGLNISRTAPVTCRSISYASTLGLPVYITENGIPAAADDPNRAKWINGCLDVVRTPFLAA